MTPERLRQIEDLYHAAREDRAVLAEVDPDLRREVESLLAQDSSKTGTLDRPAWEGAAGLTNVDATETVITPGTQLGPYKIQGPLGAGGMGQVFRAVDTRLGRSVAIKTSQQQFSDRFNREARAISSLNHPNICTLYDVGSNYLVMELCEGETLAARLKRGKLSIQETLRYGAQIADALASAHAKGITHRDLKPGNIMLSKSGIKVLDFGLAKSPQDLTLTGGRVVMGTPAYMAPEQREGKECDARTDIYALGLVLYEMASGKRLQLDQPAPLDEFPGTFAHFVKRCLERDPEDRWQSARDLQRELQWAATSTPHLEGAAVPEGARRPWLAWSVAAVLAVGLATLAFLHFREQPLQEGNRRFQVPLPEKVAADASQTISPDGRYLVFQGAGRGSNEPLWVRPLNSLTAQPLAGTEGAFFPFWSPDSKSIGFFAHGKLKRIEMVGGPAVTLADSLSGAGGAWVQDGNGGGVILFAPNFSGPILRIPSGGGAASPVTKLRPGEFSHRFPWLLPDGRHFLYGESVSVVADRYTIHVGDLSSPEDRVIGEADAQAVYTQGFLLFSRQGTLMAQPFDARRGAATGEAVPLEQQVTSRLGYSDFSASNNGLLAFRTGSSGGRVQLTWVDRSGKQLGPLGEPNIIGNFHFSPDGKRVAAELPLDHDIWIYDAARGLRTRFTFDPALDTNPVWSPDGRSIIFSSNRKQHLDLYRKSSDGSGAEEPLYSDHREKYASSWSPDGKFFLYRGAGAEGSNVWVLPLTTERQGAPLKPFPFAPSPSVMRSAQFSPDGHWIAYHSDESKRYEVYVARFPGAGGKRQISVAGGITARWRRDGKEIFYMTQDGTVMAAAVTIKADALEVGEVRPLFGPVALDQNNYSYDVSADGQRFLVALPEKQQSSAAAVTVVQNWQAGLKK